VNRSVRVRLVAHDGILEYDGVVLADDGDHIVLQAQFAERETRDLGFVVLEPDDMWTEHYWRDRWYSVKAIRTSDHALKGWYCDVAWPAEVHADVLISVDLELDLWVSADRQTVLRLDEDEFFALGVPEWSPRAAQFAWHAIVELEHLAKSGAPPFRASDRV
jgi:predicted RNA-binding protein associated with RNAse of E/G family